MKVSKSEALQTAKEDAAAVYGNLTKYEVLVEQREGDWKIDFELKNENSQGGGPHYLISGQTGEILSKRYDQ